MCNVSYINPCQKMQVNISYSISNLFSDIKMKKMSYVCNTAIKCIIVSKPNAQFRCIFSILLTNVYITRDISICCCIFNLFIWIGKLNLMCNIQPIIIFLCMGFRWMFTGSFCANAFIRANQMTRDGKKDKRRRKIWKDILLFQTIFEISFFSF